MIHKTQAFSASDIGALIRKERSAKKITQAELSRMAGYSRETIVEMESGSNVSLYTLVSVLGALGKGLEICDARPEIERLSEIFGDDENDGDQTTFHKYTPR